jgi:DNA-binding CsgD family transcriptional regulator
MSTRSALEEHVSREVTRLCLAGLDPTTLRDAVVTSLGRAMPFEGYCSYETDPPTGLITRTSLDHADEQRRRFFLGHIYVNSEIYLHAWMKENHRLAFQDWTDSAPAPEHPGANRESLQSYAEFLSAMGVTGHLTGIFVAGGEMWGGVSLFRDGRASAFPERDIALLGKLASRVGAGLKTSLLRELAGAHDPGQDAPGVLVLDRQGQVVEYTPLAERWLGELIELGLDWRERSYLPDAIWAVAAALRRALAPQTERDEVTVPSVRVRGRSGRWLSLQASLTECSGDRAGDVVIVIGPAGPRELSWLRTSGYGLTAREQAVVEHVMRGASTKQMADSLSISEYTVQDHLSHIFEKVGVRHRRALVKRLYLESWNT